MKNNQIKINDSAGGVTVIDIEGVIGMPEELQFEQPEHRITTYQKFKDAVERIAKIQSPEVVVNIRSTGGDVQDALLIYNTLKALDAKVTTRCVGYVASAATVIAQAASEGGREISAEALYLIHRSAMEAEGDASSMRHNAELLEKTDRQIAEVYARRSGHSAEEFLKIMDENNGAGRWMTPEETLNAGLVDVIVQPEKQNGWRAKISAWVDRLVGRATAPTPLPTIPKDSVRSTVRPLAPNATDTRLELLRNGQQRVTPTTTHQCEDPSIHDIKKTFNQEAYARDIENFK